MKKIYTAGIVVVVLTAIGAIPMRWLVLFLIAFAAGMLLKAFWEEIRGAIHAVLTSIPLEWRFGIFVFLTVISTIGGVTYFTDDGGIQCRFVNAVLYIISLVIAIVYMIRRLPECRWTHFYSIAWCIMLIPCMMKMVPVVGLPFAIMNILLFWHLHYVADRAHQPNHQQSNQHQPNQHQPRSHHRGFSALNQISDYSQRSSVETLYTGKIRWKFFPQNESGRVCSFHPLMWCHIPQFWRRIDIVKNGRVILIEERVLFHQPNRTNLGMVYDPDFTEGSGQWLISLICRNMEIRLIRGGKTKDGNPAQVLRFRVSNTRAELILSCLDILIQETCAFQGLHRMGHI